MDIGSGCLTFGAFRQRLVLVFFFLFFCFPLFYTAVHVSFQFDKVIILPLGPAGPEAPVFPVGPAGPGVPEDPGVPGGPGGPAGPTRTFPEVL